MTDSLTSSGRFTQFVATEKLGKTGTTVVYVFPDGNAYSKQGNAQVLPASNTEFPKNSVVLPQPAKRIGERLVEANLVTPIQRDVALYDQRSTGMRLGEILVARGWLDEQTLEQILNP